MHFKNSYRQVVVLVAKRRRLKSICLVDAKPAKIQTNRKQGFKKLFSNSSVTLLSLFNEKCFRF